MCARVCVRAYMGRSRRNESQGSAAKGRVRRRRQREAQAGAGMWTAGGMALRMTALRGRARGEARAGLTSLLAGYCSCRVHTVGMDWGVRVQPSTCAHCAV